MNLNPAGYAFPMARIVLIRGVHETESAAHELTPKVAARLRELGHEVVVKTMPRSQGVTRWLLKVAKQGVDKADFPFTKSFFWLGRLTKGDEFKGWHFFELHNYPHKAFGPARRPVGEWTFGSFRIGKSGKLLNKQAIGQGLSGEFMYELKAMPLRVVEIPAVYKPAPKAWREAAVLLKKEARKLPQKTHVAFGERNSLGRLAGNYLHNCVDREASLKAGHLSGIVVEKVARGIHTAVRKEKAGPAVERL